MKPSDLLAFACLIVPQLIAAAGAPALWPAQLSEPIYLAHVATRLTTSVLIVARLFKWSPSFEKLQLALFLAGMPVIYLWCAALRGTASDVRTELLGLVLFAPCAVLGHVRWSWLLPAGIAAHGFAWDVWHHGSSYVSDWYANACLGVDIGFGLYGALLLWRDRSERRAALTVS